MDPLNIYRVDSCFKRNVNEDGNRFDTVVDKRTGKVLVELLATDIPLEIEILSVFRRNLHLEGWVDQIIDKRTGKVLIEVPSP